MPVPDGLRERLREEVAATLAWVNPWGEWALQNVVSSAAGIAVGALLSDPTVAAALAGRGEPLRYRCCDAHDEQPCPQAETGHDLPCQPCIEQGIARCEMCADRAEGPCCSSHNRLLCHTCYRRSHFVEVCGCRRSCCALAGSAGGERALLVRTLAVARRLRSLAQWSVSPAAHDAVVAHDLLLRDVPADVLAEVYPLAASPSAALAEEERNPYLPPAPEDGRHVWSDGPADLGGNHRCNLCGAYRRSDEGKRPCRGEYAESGKMRRWAQSKWDEDRAAASPSPAPSGEPEQPERCAGCSDYLPGRPCCQVRYGPGGFEACWGAPSPSGEPEPVPYNEHEREVWKVVAERDDAIEWADRLAAALAPTDVLGEHSSANNPWQNALDYADSRGSGETADRAKALLLDAFEVIERTPSEDVADLSYLADSLLAALAPLLSSPAQTDGEREWAVEYAQPGGDAVYGFVRRDRTEPAEMADREAARLAVSRSGITAHLVSRFVPAPGPWTRDDPEGASG